MFNVLVHFWVLIFHTFWEFPLVLRVPLYNLMMELLPDKEFSNHSVVMPKYKLI